MYVQRIRQYDKPERIASATMKPYQVSRLGLITHQDSENLVIINYGDSNLQQGAGIWLHCGEGVFGGGYTDLNSGFVITALAKSTYQRIFSPNITRPD